MQVSKRVNAFLALINDYRAAKGLSCLRIEPKLTMAAGWMVNDLATTVRPLSHTDSLGRSLAQRLIAFDIKKLSCGENLYKNVGEGTAREAFDAWCKSPGHNALMLDPEFTNMGISYVLSKLSTRFLFASTTHFVDCWVIELSSED